MLFATSLLNAARQARIETNACLGKNFFTIITFNNTVYICCLMHV